MRKKWTWENGKPENEKSKKKNKMKKKPKKKVENGRKFLLNPQT
jgi:hypothetical protein